VRKGGAGKFTESLEAGKGERDNWTGKVSKTIFVRNEKKRVRGSETPE